MTALLVEELTEDIRDVSVAKALGSSTRADIYTHLRKAGTARSVREVAEVFDLHPNVVRSHLETLADAGLVAVGRRKNEGGGRPAKVYLARVRPEVAALAGPGGWIPAASLLVQLLAGLLPAEQQREQGRGIPLLRRAYERALGEGRSLVSESARPDRPGFQQAVEAAVAALLPYAPNARILKAGEEWVDLVGLAGLFEVLTPHRPAIADALERGLLTGAIAACGVTATVVDAGSLPDGTPVWRARALPAAGTRGAVTPAGSIDTRGLHREAGVVRAMRAVTALRGGEVLEVLTEGPGSPAAFARWADRAGHQLLGVERATDASGRPGIRLLIRKGA